MESHPENRIDANQSSELAGNTAQAMLDILNHIDGENSSRSNVVIGIGAAVLTLALPRLEAAIGLASAGLGIAIAGTIIAIINAVITIKPSVFSSKKGLNLMYPGSYTHLLSGEQYSAKLKEMFQHDRNIVSALATELYTYGGTVTTQAKRLEASIQILVISLSLGMLLQGAQWAMGAW